MITLENNLQRGLGLSMEVVTEKMLERVERLMEEGRHDEAEKLCHALLCREPSNIGALFLAGNLAFHARAWIVAITHFRDACSLDPANTILYNNLGLALMEAVQSKELDANSSFEEAALVLEKALALQPDYVSAWKSLGIVRREQGDTGGARFCFTQGLAVAPNDAALWVNLGKLHTTSYEYDLAIGCYRRALRLNPCDRADVLNHLAIVQCCIGRISDAISSYDQAIALASVREQRICYASNRLLTLHYLPGLAPDEIARDHRAWRERCFPSVPGQYSALNSDPNRRLRVGYVSSDLRMNAVLFFIQPVLAAHDPAQVKVFCYANVKNPDTATRQLQEGYGIAWRDIAGQGDADAAQLIRDDGIDILVDLSGHAGDNRLPLFGLHPAPIQVTWIGYPDTTGLPAMDYRITDAKADPPGMTEHLHTEELIRLPRSFLCYRPGGDFPPEGPLPLLTKRYVTFGSMNNFSKINAPLLAIWGEILALVPGSRLVLRYRGKDKERVFRELTGHLDKKGIEPERLVLLGHARSVVEQMQAYHLMDIALDTFPYNGTTTTCEALYMGVPVVTLAGHSHVARVGASLLETAGLGDLVAESAGEYTEKAVTLAGDLRRLLELRKGLRQMLMNSPLADNVTFTAQVEQAYRQIWQRWCREQATTPVNRERQP